LGILTHSLAEIRMAPTRDCGGGRFSLGYGVGGSSAWQSSKVGPSPTGCVEDSSCSPWSWFGSSGMHRCGGSKGGELGFQNLVGEILIGGELGFQPDTSKEL
jgi:hypothetical protein